MTRYAVYAIPGIEEGAPEAAVRLREDVERWYARGDMREITVDARRYGLHATLKAPFRLADGATERALVEAVEAFADARTAVCITGIRPAVIGNFRALIPSDDTAASAQLAEVAADTVRAFDDLRAQLSEAEVARRRPEQLTPRQRELLDEWGYPYVLEEFRFHLTLTDPVPAERTGEVDAALAEHFAAHIGRDIPLTALTVAIEPEPGAPFRTLSVHPFRAARRAPEETR